jgi:hypothetical protein
MRMSLTLSRPEICRERLVTLPAAEGKVKRAALRYAFPLLLLTFG